MGAEREGEYEEKGDYHKELDPGWKYYPIYIAKMEYITRFLQSVQKETEILDAGCGEGVLVEEYRNAGYAIRGLDLNYSSVYVTQGDLLNIPFDDETFDLVLCLDVIEHLNCEDQGPALREIRRILKKDGQALLAVPNLAHFASRLSFLFTGRLIRTSTVDRHRGDRPIQEYLKLIGDEGFTITNRTGIFPTLPVTSLLTYLYPGRVMPLHRLLNRIVPYANWCFLNIILCQKDDSAGGESRNPR
jgi:SAM-dependent methyltransferase